MDVYMYIFQTGQVVEKEYSEGLSYSLSLLEQLN